MEIRAHPSRKIFQVEQHDVNISAPAAGNVMLCAHVCIIRVGVVGGGICGQN